MKLCIPIFFLNFSIRDKAPGQRECESAIEHLALNIRQLDQASLAAINQNLEVRKDKDIKVFTEQMENAAKQLAAKLPDVQESSKNEAERLVLNRHLNVLKH